MTETRGQNAYNWLVGAIVGIARVGVHKETCEEGGVGGGAELSKGRDDNGAHDVL